MPPSQWLNLEHRVYENLLEQKLKGSSVLIALSGGADSLCLTHVLHRLQSSLSLQLALAHVHHGSGENSEQSHYREKARGFCASLAKKLSLPFFEVLYSGKVPLKSEALLRDFRYESLLGILENKGYGYLALGHHGGDLLETRLMHLLRGTGVKGLLALSVLEGKRLRPLLPFPKSDILHYLRQREIEWLEDPQNQAPRFLRTWLRSHLEKLEAFRPGSLKTLSRSFRMVESSLKVSHEWPQVLLETMEWEEKGLSRSVYNGLSEGGRHTLIATYMSCLLHKKRHQDFKGKNQGKDKGQGQKAKAKIKAKTKTKAKIKAKTKTQGQNQGQNKGFSQGQVAEVVKRLQRTQKVFSFSLAGYLWRINARRILALRPRHQDTAVR